MFRDLTADEIAVVSGGWDSGENIIVTADLGDYLDFGLVELFGETTGRNDLSDFYSGDIGAPSGNADEIIVTAQLPPLVQISGNVYGAHYLDGIATLFEWVPNDETWWNPFDGNWNRLGNATYSTTVNGASIQLGSGGINITPGSASTTYTFTNQP
jgi:hypothetical protein